jgi:hypothetical protein
LPIGNFQKQWLQRPVGIAVILGKATAGVFVRAAWAEGFNKKIIKKSDPVRMGLFIHHQTSSP